MRYPFIALLLLVTLSAPRPSYCAFALGPILYKLQEFTRKSVLPRTNPHDVDMQSFNFPRFRRMLEFDEFSMGDLQRWTDALAEKPVPNFGGKSLLKFAKIVLRAVGRTEDLRPDTFVSLLASFYGLAREVGLDSEQHQDFLKLVQKTYSANPVKLGEPTERAQLILGLNDWAEANYTTGVWRSGGTVLRFEKPPEFLDEAGTVDRMILFLGRGPDTRGEKFIVRALSTHDADSSVLIASSDRKFSTTIYLRERTFPTDPFIYARADENGWGTLARQFRGFTMEVGSHGFDFVPARYVYSTQMPGEMGFTYQVESHNLLPGLPIFSTFAPAVTVLWSPPPHSRWEIRCADLVGRAIDGELVAERYAAYHLLPLPSLALLHKAFGKFGFATFVSVQFFEWMQKTNQL